MMIHTKTSSAKNREHAIFSEKVVFGIESICKCLSLPPMSKCSNNDAYILPVHSEKLCGIYYLGNNVFSIVL